MALLVKDVASSGGSTDWYYVYAVRLSHGSYDYYK